MNVLPETNINEVILHVGLHKTGTSSIQSTLYNGDNNKLLLKEGILYPRCWGRNHGTVLGSAFHNEPEKFWPNKFPKILSKEEIKNKDRLNLEKFETTVNSSVAKRLVISGEVISKLTINNIRKMKDYLMDIGFSQAKFKIMIYTRNPVTWAVSDLQQQLHGGGWRYDKELDKLKGQILPTLFQERIGKFIEVFGEKAVHVYPFEKARTHDFGMVGHFLEELNVNNKLIKDIKQIRKNESISMFTGEFLAYVNDRIPLIINGKHNENRHKSDHRPLIKVRGDKFDIPLKEKKKIVLVTEQDMKWLKENYGIDYTNEEILETKKYQNVDLSLKDVESIYPILSKTLRDTLIEFMENKLILEIPSNHKNQCFELINRLKEQEKSIIWIDRQEKKLQSRLNISEMDKGIIYQELALFMEAYGQIGAAELMMSRASQYRPNSEFIRKKHEKYKQKLGYGNLVYKQRKGSMNKNMQNKTLPVLSKKKQALSGIGFAIGSIGLFSLLIKRRKKYEAGRTRGTNKYLEFDKEF